MHITIAIWWPSYDRPRNRNCVSLLTGITWFITNDKLFDSHIHQIWIKLTSHNRCKMTFVKWFRVKLLERVDNQSGGVVKVRCLYTTNRRWSICYRKSRFRILGKADLNANIILLTMPAELYVNIEIVISLTCGLSIFIEITKI